VIDELVPHHLNLLHLLLSEFVLNLQVLLEPLQLVRIQFNSNLGGCFLDGSRWKIQIYVVWELDSLGLCVCDVLGNLLSISLVASVVLDLDVEVKRSL
jgi:hypothetical protein